MQRCQFAGHVIGRALCLFCDPALPAFEGRGPIKTSLLDDLPRLDRGKATEDDLHAVGGGVELDVVPRSDDIGGEIVGGALRLVFAARVIEYLPPVGHCRQRGRAGLCDTITDLFGPFAGGVKVRGGNAASLHFFVQGGRVERGKGGHRFDAGHGCAPFLPRRSAAAAVGGLAGRGGLAG